ncbi:MAG: hypothetical protein WC796_06030 [Candidatus Pacearchaeota archaeon]|jgi:hypothetical protein
MACKNNCQSYRRLVSKLEGSITTSGVPYVPETFESRAEDYCAQCRYDEREGTGYRRTRSSTL